MNMNYKNGLSIAVVLVLISVFTACGSVSGINENEEAENEHMTETEEENRKAKENSDTEEEASKEINREEKFAQIIEDHAGMVISSMKDEQYAIFSIAAAPGSVHGIIDMGVVREASEDGENIDIIEDLHNDEKTYVDRLEDHLPKGDNTIISIEEVVISPDYKKIAFLANYEESSKEGHMIRFRKIYIANLSLPIEITAESDVEGEILMGPMWNNESDEIQVRTGSGEETHMLNGN